METKDVMDFSDLGGSTLFLFNGVKYAIPPLTRAMMTKLLRVNQKITESVATKKDSDVAEAEFNESSVSAMDNMFQLQQEFVCLGIRKVSEQGAFLEVVKEEIEEWPMRLLNKVIRLINDALTTTSKDDMRPT